MANRGSSFRSLSPQRRSKGSSVSLWPTNGKPHDVVFVKVRLKEKKKKTRMCISTCCIVIG